MAYAATAPPTSAMAAPTPAKAAPTPAAPPKAAPRMLALQRALVWLAGASAAIVFVEPSPYELVTVVAAVIFFATGLRLRLLFMPPLLLLVLINTGYSIGAIPLLDNSIIASWIATSWYMALTVVFLAMVMSEDTIARLDMLRRGLIVGGIIASLAAIAGYFNLVPGGYDLLTLYGRGRGTFKDPNVLGAFLVLPSLFVLQDVVTACFSKALRSAIALGIMALAILLAFSRAAWGQLILTAMFMLALMVMTSRSNAERSRIVVVTIIAALAAALLVAVLLSFSSVADMFEQRASFDQSYDEGRFGRFGRHMLGADMALDLPFGIGPLQFHRFFPEDTHNSYLNAFMSGGWLSGVCYPALVFVTVITGFRHVFVRVPWQRSYLAVSAAFLGTVGESFVIDTDHWRHFFMMLGVMWGLFAAAQRCKSCQMVTAAERPPRLSDPWHPRDAH